LVLKGSQLSTNLWTSFVFDWEQSASSLFIGHLDISCHYKQKEISVLFGIHLSNCDEKLSSPSSSFCGIHQFCFTKGRAEISPIVWTFMPPLIFRHLENAFFDRSTNDSLPSFLTGLLSSNNAYPLSIILKIILGLCLSLSGCHSVKG